jgi:hypothetical protein
MEIYNVSIGIASTGSFAASIVVDFIIVAVKDRIEPSNFTCP